MYDRDPITGPVGVVLCGGGGAELLGLGADVGCGRGGAGSPVGCGGAEGEGGAEDDEDAVCASLIAPPLGRSPGEPWAIAAPLGRSVPPVPLPVSLALLAALLPLVEETAPGTVCGAGCRLGVLLQAAQTRAATTAVVAALAGATVPLIGMVATVAKWTVMREDSFSCTQCAARLLHRIRPGRLFA